MSDKTETTILLDIYERLGAIETELKNINEDHKEAKEELKEAKKDLKDLKEFKTRLAAYIWLGGSVASGVMFFLYNGLKYAADRWLH